MIGKIENSHIRRLDLSLLVLFQDLMISRQTTATAKRLGMSQSAVSHALARLRDILQDQLFIRMPSGLQPTQRALDILPKVETLIALAHEVVSASEAFSPASSKRLFRFAANDLVATLFGGPLINELRIKAPLARLTFKSTVGRAALAALASGEIDLALGHFPTMAAGYDVTHLFEEHFVVVARRKHPKLRNGVDLATYQELDHILVSFSGGLMGFADMALKARNLSRRVVASLPTFLASFAAVADGDAIATVPACLAARYAKSFGLTIYDAPLQIRSFSLTAVRHNRTKADTGLDWIVGRLLEISRHCTERVN